MKVLAQDLIVEFKKFDIDYQSKWEDIRPKVADTSAYKAFQNEHDCQKVFEVRKNYLLLSWYRMYLYLYLLLFLIRF